MESILNGQRYFCAVEALKKKRWIGHCKAAILHTELLKFFIVVWGLGFQVVLTYYCIHSAIQKHLDLVINRKKNVGLI